MDVIRQRIVKLQVQRRGVRGEMAASPPRDCSRGKELSWENERDKAKVV